MRARLILCTTLLIACHPALWAQAVTKQLPPSQDSQSATPNQALDSLTSQTDPAFAPSPRPSDQPSAMPLGSYFDTQSDTPEEDQTLDSDMNEMDSLQNSSVPAASQNDRTPDDSVTDDTRGTPRDPAIATVIPAPLTGTPVHIEADDQQKVGDVYTLSGHVVIHYKQYVVQADHATYNTATSIVDANGHLIVDGGPSDEHMLASRGTMNMDAHTAHYWDVAGTLGVRKATHSKFVFTAPNPFALTGKEVIQLGPNNYQVLSGSMTSCRLPDPDWKLLANSILIQNGRASARNSVFDLMGFPILYLPYVSHPVAVNQRSTGLLLPIFGNDTQKGAIVGEEIYFALDRSSDLTVGTQYFSRRGFAPLGQYRYRGRGEDFGLVRFHALLDRLPGTLNQGGVDLSADGKRIFSPHTRAVGDIEYLSSYTYRQAFEENYSAAINSEVKSQVYLVHQKDNVAETVRFDRYQNFFSDDTGDEIRILHFPDAQIDALDKPIGRTPLLFGGTAAASVISRSEPGFQTSNAVPRVDLYPHIALPLSAGGWTIRPDAGIRETYYAKSQNAGPVGVVPSERDASLNRTAFESNISLRTPGLERDFSAPWLRSLFGGDLRHTIEPTLNYRYVTGINNFNSVLRFDNTDVMSNTNEVEYGLTQRLFLRHLHSRPCKGDEALGPSDTCGGGTVDWLSWTVKQKHFFNRDFGGAAVNGARNVLDSTLDFTGVAFLSGPRSYSPVISRLRLRTTTTTDMEWDLDYDTRSGRIQASNLTASYRLDAYSFSIGDYKLHTLNPVAANSVTATATAPITTTSANTVTDFNQLRLAAVYGSALKQGLSAGMNVGYDFAMNEVQYLSAQAGYNRSCCGFSMEVRRYSLGVVRDDTQYLFSFTLAGVGTAGSISQALRVF